MQYRIQNVRRPYPNELYHHGIKGQRWGVRRYQNPDGSLTAEGKRHYSTSEKTYNQLKSETAMTGLAYDQARKKAESAQNKFFDNTDKLVRKYGEANALTNRSKREVKKYDKLQANLIDSKVSENFWKNQNRQLIKASEDTRKVLNKHRDQPLSQIQTKTLRNGERIIKDKILSDNEILALAVGGTAYGGPMVGVAGGLIGYGVKPIDYRKRMNDSLKEEGKMGLATKQYKERKKAGYYK